MEVKEKQGAAGIIAVIVFIIIVIGIVMANRWLQKEMSAITPQPAETPPAKQVSAAPKKEKPKVKRTGEVIRKTRLSPDRKYKINVFYQEGVEIARNRSSNGEVYDQTGEIPDGKVKFINESDQTYGVEYYRDQKLHGQAQVYYSDDVLKQDLDYQYGKLMTTTEYYHDGSVRMTEDYTDARERSDDEEEVGIGKVYFRDGKLKYEWHLTVKDPIGFKKSYDRKGRLVAEFYYDEFGYPMESKKTVPDLNAATSADSLPSGNSPSTPEAPAVINERPPKQIFIPAS